VPQFLLLLLLSYDVGVTEDVVYGSGLTLDLYEPAGAAAPRVRPAFVAMHGGGWTRGTKRNENMVELCRELAARGFVCASIGYRLTGDVDDAADDAEQALRWLVRNARKYNVDPKRIAIGGSSAGAITALHVAYGRRNANVRAVLSWAGGLEGREEMLQRGGPALFLVHGTADRSIPVEEARAILKRARAVGLRHEAYICSDIGHNAPLDRRPFGVSLYDRLAAFLSRGANAPVVHDAIPCPH
jgi:predicted esterase